MPFPHLMAMEQERERSRSPREGMDPPTEAETGKNKDLKDQIVQELLTNLLDICPAVTAEEATPSKLLQSNLSLGVATVGFYIYIYDIYIYTYLYIYISHHEFACSHSVLTRTRLPLVCSGPDRPMKAGGATDARASRRWRCPSVFCWDLTIEKSGDERVKP